MHDLFRHAGDFFQDGFRPVAENFAGRSQRQAAASAIEKRRADLPLQCRDLPAERRLRDIKLFRHA